MHLKDLLLGHDLLKKTKNQYFLWHVAPATKISCFPFWRVLLQNPIRTALLEQENQIEMASLSNREAKHIAAAMDLPRRS